MTKTLDRFNELKGFEIKGVVNLLPSTLSWIEYSNNLLIYHVFFPNSVTVYVSFKSYYLCPT